MTKLAFPGLQFEEPIVLTESGEIWGKRFGITGTFSHAEWLEYIETNVESIEAMVRQHALCILQCEHYHSDDPHDSFKGHFFFWDQWRKLRDAREGSTVFCDPWELLIAGYSKNGTKDVPHDPAQLVAMMPPGQKIEDAEKLQQHASSLQRYYLHRYCQTGAAVCFGSSILHCRLDDRATENEKILHCHPSYALQILVDAFDPETGKPVICRKVFGALLGLHSTSAITDSDCWEYLLFWYQMRRARREDPVSSD